MRGDALQRSDSRASPDRLYCLCARYAATRGCAEPLPQKKLPDYMLPSRFVALNVLPLTPNGKVHYDLLPKLFVQEAEHFEETLAAPYDPLEQELSDSWRKILQLERVGLDDNFFALSGHSLSIVQFIAFVQSTYELHLSVSDIFLSPTIEQIARVIRDKLRVARDDAIR